MVERAQELDVARQQHAVAEHVTRHVADPDHREIGCMSVEAQLAEVALDRLPGAAGGDAHPLVVVPLRAAGGERVTEPEAVVGGDAVGDIGERGRSLVGGDDEVRVVLVVADHLRRRNDLAADDVVCQIEQAAQKRPITGDDLLLERLAATLHRWALDHEAALRANRNDQRVLDHLRLHQAQDLGAEVLAPVRPAQATARHLAAA